MRKNKEVLAAATKKEWPAIDARGSREFGSGREHSGGPSMPTMEGSSEMAG